MWKYIVVGVMAAVLFLSLAAWAEEGGSATATVTFNSVINTSVEDNWDPITIDQSTIAGWTGPMPIDWDGEDVNITVTVQALTDYAVYGAYYAEQGGFQVASGFFTSEDAVIWLNSTTAGFTFDGYVDYYYYTTPEDGGADTGQMTDLSFGGSNNVPDGDEVEYEVFWNPSSIDDLGEGDSVDFTIIFAVTDSST